MYRSPKEIFGQLFEDLHLSEIWDDGKRISDAIPLRDPQQIVELYSIEKSKKDFNLKTFFEKHFKFQKDTNSSFESDTNLSAEAHVKKLWPHLKREKDAPVKGSSLVPLPFPYLVPGGRFKEIYYWDSYFTMLGLAVHNEWKVISDMIENFQWLISTFGFIPNGNRSYFLSRSQPPFYALMVDLLASHKGSQVYIENETSLLKEYDFWMNKIGLANSHVIELVDGSLNRYVDQKNEERQEMYKDDFELKQKSENKDLFLHLRSACESGWDFSTRWMLAEDSLQAIETTKILPVDLNCLIFHLELTLAKTFGLKGNLERQIEFQKKAEVRKALILKYFWNDEINSFSDYNWERQETISKHHLACVFPLYFEIASADQANAVAEQIKDKFLKPGGLVTTLVTSGQQWDSPNGWAPLQWMAVKGLLNYGHQTLAKDIMTRWLVLNEKIYSDSGKFVEKYNVVDTNLKAGGGEYPVQDGFGWSNGVYVAFKSLIVNL